MHITVSSDIERTKGGFPRDKIHICAALALSFSLSISASGCGILCFV
jgi:hypothetical protein